MHWLFIGIAAAVVALLAVLALRRYLAYLADRRIAAYQHDLMLKHYAEVENMYAQMRGWRHDYHNHIQAMKVFLKLGQQAEHEAYLQMLDADLTAVDTMVKSGNIMVDAILNSKISLAVSKQIKINAKAAVPQTVKFPEVDLCAIIGNLLDNAIESCMGLPEAARFIRLYIGTHKGMFYISVSNAAGGALKKAGKSYLSTKLSPAHGFGLTRIDRITDKYGGFVNRQNEEGVFATEVMLPL